MGRQLLLRRDGLRPPSRLLPASLPAYLARSRVRATPRQRGGLSLCARFLHAGLLAPGMASAPDITGPGAAAMGEASRAAPQIGREPILAIATMTARRPTSVAARKTQE